MIMVDTLEEMRRKEEMRRRQQQKFSSDTANRPAPSGPVEAPPMPPPPKLEAAPKPQTLRQAASGYTYDYGVGPITYYQMNPIKPGSSEQRLLVDNTRPNVLPAIRTQQRATPTSAVMNAEKRQATVEEVNRAAEDLRKRRVAGRPPSLSGLVPGADIGVQSQNGMTRYETPEGSATFQGARQGGGSLSALADPSAAMVQRGLQNGGLDRDIALLQVNPELYGQLMEARRAAADRGDFGAIDRSYLSPQEKALADKRFSLQRLANQPQQVIQGPYGDIRDFTWAERERRRAEEEKRPPFEAPVADYGATGRGLLGAFDEQQQTAASLAQQQREADQRTAIDAESLGLQREGLDIQREQNRLAALAAANQPSIYDQTLERERAKFAVQTEVDRREADKGAKSLFAKLDLLESKSDETGFLNNLAASLGKPLNSDATTRQEVYLSLSESIALDMAQALRGSFSNADIEFVRRQAPRFSNSPEGNKQIIKEIKNYTLARLAGTGLDISPYLEQQGAGGSSTTSTDTGGAVVGTQADRDEFTRRYNELIQQGKSREEAYMSLQADF